jgi:hemerythrin-like domain-containing protein
MNMRAFLERAGIPNENGPIGRMLPEHNEGRKYIADMSASIINGSYGKRNP